MSKIRYLIITFICILFLGNTSLANQKSAEVFNKRLEAAQNGDADSQYHVSNMYKFGKGVEKDLQKSDYWFQKALDNGNVLAQYEKGRGLFNDKGRHENNPEEAYKWYLKAADNGSIFAMNSLGNLYRGGHGVEQNEEKAFKWYIKAAENGYSPIYSTLANMYMDGVGVEQNVDQAYKWYLAAARNFNKDSIKIVLEATLESIGEGLVNDGMYDEYMKYDNFKKARAWGLKQIKDSNVAQVQWLVSALETDLKTKYDLLVKSAKNGSALAQAAIGTVYYQHLDESKYSKIVNKDYVEAYKWRLISVKNGLSHKKADLREIRVNLTTDEIKTARKRANDWMKKYPQEKDEYANAPFFVSK